MPQNQENKPRKEMRKWELGDNTQKRKISKRKSYGVNQVILDGSRKRSLKRYSNIKEIKEKEYLL